MPAKVVKLDIGTVYQKTANGGYYFRYQLNGRRKAVSLQTKNLKDALAKAREFVPIVKSTTPELISAHVQQARGMAGKERPSLRLGDAWEVYSRHPDRAIPATIAEQNSYRATFEEFVDTILDKDMAISEVDRGHAAAFSTQMRGSMISVSTHKRKIRRVRKIFGGVPTWRPDKGGSFCDGLGVGALPQTPGFFKAC